MTAPSCPIPQRSLRFGLQAGHQVVCFQLVKLGQDFLKLHPWGLCGGLPTPLSPVLLWGAKSFPWSKEDMKGTCQRGDGKLEGEHSLWRCSETLRTYRIRQTCSVAFVLLSTAKEDRRKCELITLLGLPNFSSWRCFLHCYSLLNWVLDERDVQAALPPMFYISTGSRAEAQHFWKPPTLPSSLSTVSLPQSCCFEDWAKGFEDQNPNGNQFHFSLTVLEKGIHVSSLGFHKPWVQTSYKVWSEKGGLPAHPDSDIYTVGNANLIPTWSARLCPMVVVEHCTAVSPESQKQLTSKGLNEHQLWGHFFCEPRNDKIKPNFSYTNRVGSLQVQKIGLKQGINQNNWQMWGTTGKGDGSLKGTDGFRDTKVCSWRRGTPKSKTQLGLASQGQCLASSHLLYVSKRHQGLRALSYVPRVAEPAVCAAPGPLGLVHSQEGLCESRGHVNPGLSPGSLTFTRLSLSISEQGTFWVFSPVTFCLHIFVQRGRITAEMGKMLMS